MASVDSRSFTTVDSLMKMFLIALLAFVCRWVSSFSFTLFNFLSVLLQLPLTIPPLPSSLSGAAGLRKNRFRRVNLIWSLQRLKLASYWFFSGMLLTAATVKWPTVAPSLHLLALPMTKFLFPWYQNVNGELKCRLSWSYSTFESVETVHFICCKLELCWI